MSLYYEADGITLYHGDCLTEHREWLEADVLVTDPPYGTQLVGYGRRFVAIANDSNTDYRDEVLELWGGRPRLVFGSPRMPEPLGEWGDRLVWDKAQPGMNGGPWRYTHENIFIGGDGWVRTSNSAFSIIKSVIPNGGVEKSWHVHAKPEPLMANLILAAPPGTIADPFAGSGSTLVAARNLGRKAIGVELEEKYCELIAKRLSNTPLSMFAERTWGND